jgi:hypothetical protein
MTLTLWQRLALLVVGKHSRYKQVVEKPCRSSHLATPLPGQGWTTATHSEGQCRRSQVRGRHRVRPHHHQDHRRGHQAPRSRSRPVAAAALATSFGSASCTMMISPRSHATAGLVSAVRPRFRCTTTTQSESHHHHPRWNQNQSLHLMWCLTPATTRTRHVARTGCACICGTRRQWPARVDGMSL